ncbi:MULTISPECIES: hypothetical protein [Thalassospira]|uniref:Nodulation protein B n=2 Tax=Thalassospira TaxID=168934 RepID=A0A367WCF2_9PROT|nr:MULTISPECIES: hypothetical protein [Thalassospira]MDG4717409.1 hypothetical protein [Thalassospira sp. FZY0004]RCK39113.1 hypothetical protein TH19_04860 [Thalassospira profundimaris]
MTSSTQIFLGKIALRLAPSLYLRKVTHWTKNHLQDVQPFFLSFDCDTNRDAEASLKIQRQLHKANIRAAYAIPGALLEKHWGTYRDLQALGGYFVNHGYREHAAIDDTTGKPYSTFTYRDEDRDIWQRDIVDGHNAIQTLTGNAPYIFRTPHFGEFNKPHQLSELYKFLATLNYRISTSTTPVFSYINGGMYGGGAGIIEIPLSGSIARPSQLIDSWGFLSAPDALGRNALIRELKSYLATLSSGSKLLTNIYFDPADIADDQEILDLLVKFEPHCNSGYDNPTLGKMY